MKLLTVKKWKVIIFAFLISLSFGQRANAYYLIDNFVWGDVSYCGINPFQFWTGATWPYFVKAPVYLAPGAFEESHPHNAQCGNTVGESYGAGGEVDYANTTDADNEEDTISLMRLNGLLQFFYSLTLSVPNDSSTMRFVYDGVDNDPDVISFTNISLDLSADNVFSLFVATSTAESVAIVRLYTDGTNYSEVTKVLPNSQNVYQSADIPFSEFSAQGAGVELSDITAIEVELQNTATSTGNIINKENNALMLLACNFYKNGDVYPPWCNEDYFGLGVGRVETNTQLQTSIEATLYDDAGTECDDQSGIGGDIECDGDFDSTAVDGDTILYTVTLTNTDDLLDADATDVIYTADFVTPEIATFVDGSVDVSSTFEDTAVIDDETGNVLVDVGTIPDGETVTITYRVQILAGQQDDPNVSYSHVGNVNAEEWDDYDLTADVVEINKFNIETLMTAAPTAPGVLYDFDIDGFSGEGELVTFTATLENVGVNTSQVDFFQDAIDLGTIETVSAPGGTITYGGDGSFTVSYASLAPAATVTINFDVRVDTPFSFAEYDRISAQALVTNSSSIYFGVSDDPDVATSLKDPTVAFIDAFPNRADAYQDSDGDGLPENCIPDCDDEDANPNDTDNDGLENDNPAEDDTDGDGTDDIDDAFPFHVEADTDTDGDGMPDTCLNDCADSQLTLDLDDDNDGTDDIDDDFPLNNAADTDADNDGLPDDWLESCDSTCQINSGLTLDNDDDNDLVIDSSDDFPLNIAASSDEDMDGFPDFWNASCNITCQNNSGLTLDTSVNDIDNDGVIDSQDAFDDDCSASVDTDTDGQPDQFHDPLPEGCELGALVEDTDDDGDTVLDGDDDFPLNEAASIDADVDGFPDEWNGTCDSTCQNNSGLTLDPFLNDTDNNGVENDADNDAADDDGDGILNGDEEPGFELIDNNPPIVAPPADRTVTAVGKNTTVLLGFATATDYVQGVLVSLSQDNISADNTGPFAVGVHTITWTATDAAGNVGTATQKITVKENPDLQKGGKKSGGGGGSLGLLSIFALMLFYARRKLVFSF